MAVDNTVFQQAPLDFDGASEGIVIRSEAFATGASYETFLAESQRLQRAYIVEEQARYENAWKLWFQLGGAMRRCRAGGCSMTTLLNLALVGKSQELTEQLRALSHKICQGRGSLSDDDRLIVDADIAMQRGDLAHATDLLRLRAHPKWPSERACRNAYMCAMATMGGRAT